MKRIVEPLVEIKANQKKAAVGLTAYILTFKLQKAKKETAA